MTTTKGNPSQRTYGTKLLETKRGKDKYPVTKRICDIDLLNRTGEIRYIDEEAKDVPTVSQIENGKKMREEITTLEQFQAIGGYADVAKKYNVAPTSAHGLLQSLKAKKVREEKGVDNQTGNVVSDARDGAQVETEGQDVGDCAKEGITESCAVNVDELTQTLTNDHCLRISMDEQLTDKIIDKMDGNLDLQIGHMWQVVKSDLEIIHKMHMERAEQVFREQLASVMGGVSN